MITDGRGDGKMAGSQSASVDVVREVREVPASETAQLRRDVLRGGRPVALPGDDEPAFHVGVYEGQLLVGTGNVRLDPPPFEAAAPAWRLRGMATLPSHRSQGVGALVLHALLEHCRAQGGATFWCNARTPARAFYERAGLMPIGEPWDDPEIGPHVRMWMSL